MISTRGRYALRVLLQLAKAPENTLVSLDSICQDEQISKKYLESIVRQLVADGYLIGQRGKNGGYRLAKPAASIAVIDVLESAEGTLAPVACLKEGAPACERQSECQTLPLWERYFQMTQSFFGGISLQDLQDGQF